MEPINHSEYHILIVEDDPEIRDGIEIFLRSQGYQVHKAGNGVEGLKLLEQEPIDLAIVDVMMPQMDGITMTVKLREKYEFPVIILSAKSEETDKVMGLNIGADDYVTKPFTPLELMARVNSQLRRYSRFKGRKGEKVHRPQICRYQHGQFQKHYNCGKKPIIRRGIHVLLYGGHNSHRARHVVAPHLPLYKHGYALYSGVYIELHPVGTVPYELKDILYREGILPENYTHTA